MLKHLQVNLGDIGEIVKVRLSHDNTGGSPHLFVSHLRMQRIGQMPRPSAGAPAPLNSAPSAVANRTARGPPRSPSVPLLTRGPLLTDLTFYFNCWLSRDLGDGEIVREVPSRASMWLEMQEVRKMKKRPSLLVGGSAQLKRTQLISPVLPVENVLPSDPFEQTPLPS